MKLSIYFKFANKFAGIAAALLLMPVVLACQDQEVATTPAPTTQESPSTTESTASSQTIVETAIANGSFNTLVAALKAADLVDTLNAPGPYTVFAPTDEAFAALPAGVLDKLLLPKNKATLTKILTYHVVAGNVPASAVKTGSGAQR